MGERRSVGPKDLDECWCCGGLHDRLSALCPGCYEAGCSHFGGECQSDHNPVMPDGGRQGVGTERDPIERVKASGGNLVLDFNSRIGARPYARYVDGEWDLMSLSHVPTPQYGQDDPDTDHGVNTTVHTVDLEPDPADHPEEDLRVMATKPRHLADGMEGWPGVEVIPFEESPFASRDEIPTRDEIVQERDCAACGEEYRQYLPEPFAECPHCGAELEQENSQP